MAALAFLLVTLSPSSRLTAGGQAPDSPAAQQVVITHVLVPDGESPAIGSQGRVEMITADAPVNPDVTRETFASSSLSVTALFDSTINSNGNATAIKARIAAAIADLQSRIATPIAVTIGFKTVPTGLGQSQTCQYTGQSYSTFLSKLKASATSANDNTAYSKLTNPTTNPVNGLTTIDYTTALSRALGIAGQGATCSTLSGFPNVDSVIGVNTAITNPGDTGSSKEYNLIPVLLHELDEALATSSGLFKGATVSTINPEPADLFPYNSSGVRSFTATDSRTDSSARSFFSIDGTTLLAEYNNQPDGGDFGDWQANPLRSGVSPKVQDSNATPGTSPTLGSG